MPQPANRFERHAGLTLTISVLVVLGIVEAVSAVVLAIDPFDADDRSLELASYKAYDVWTLFQNRPNQSMRFDFKGVVEDAEFGLDEHGFVLTADQPETPEASVVLLGGSTVFGVGASSYRTTIASHLQRLLNERAPGRYIVHNAGVRGFHSLQEFTTYVNDIRPGLRPSIVVSLNGRNDDHLMRKAIGRGNFDTDYSDQLQAAISDMMDDGLEPTYLDALAGLARSTRFGRLVATIAAPRSGRAGDPMARLGEFGLPPDEALFRGPAENYAMVMNALDAAVTTGGGRFVWALQPTVFEKPMLTGEEEDRVVEVAGIPPSLFETHRAYHEAFYDVARAQGALDLSGIFANEPRTIYLDDCHYNDLGNELIAQRLLPMVLDAGSRHAKVAPTPATPDAEIDWRSRAATGAERAATGAERAATEAERAAIGPRSPGALRGSARGRAMPSA